MGNGIMLGTLGAIGLACKGRFYFDEMLQMGVKFFVSVKSAVHSLQRFCGQCIVAPKMPE